MDMLNRRTFTKLLASALPAAWLAGKVKGEGVAPVDAMFIKPDKPFEVRFAPKPPTRSVKIEEMIAAPGSTRVKLSDGRMYWERCDAKEMLEWLWDKGVEARYIGTLTVYGTNTFPNLRETTIGTCWMK